MKQYKLVNNLLGWIVFAIAAWTYCSTIEWTASFWDCPEFITTGYKLEVGHPPGAPFFMLVANLFSQFAADTAHVAMMVNIMSALLSAACILFLFWTITHLARKLVCPEGVVQNTAQTVLIMGCGAVGALAYTWSDTFWFSAVEGEVYAFSSMFTAAVFWLMLKWEEHADEPHADRWLVLIAYLMGLSIGVHLLNLLCIPAMVLVYYFKRRPNANWRGSLLALVFSMVLVAVVLYGVVPGLVKVGGWFELAFTNYLHMPFNTGTVIYLALLVACMIWAIYESFALKSRKRIIASFLIAIALLGVPFVGDGFKSVVAAVIILAALGWLLQRPKKGGKAGEYLLSARVVNTTLLCFLMLMIGYSSYAVIVIRSTANPPMDQNSPEDVFSLGSYLNREQYGQWPLFYGQAYTSQPKLKEAGDGSGMLTWDYKEGAPIWQRKEKASPNERDSYEVVGHKRTYLYAQNMLFPRMWDEAHAQSYESWMNGVEGRNVPYNDPSGRVNAVKMPTQWENLKFFLSYQVNFMYWRYFMWNFAGRQNDLQGQGEWEHGNWITGIKFLDNLRLGDQDLLPDELKENKGHNVFYCLPLLLGLLGLFWQTYRGREGVRQFWVVFFLFFMTGLAIVFYLNQTPVQPRERDYAYAGSFYAFAIWIGLGVAAIARGLQRTKFSPMASAVTASVLCLLVPLQMVSQTWDDHDRSHRYTCRDFGANYLMSLQKKGNPIIFTNGDNDTFPLWYNQEVEGKRTDARVCNMSYIQTDWYIDQMKRPAYDSPALPITWSRLEYVSNGQNEAVRVEPSQKQALADLNRQHPEVNMFELTYILDNFVRNPDPSLRFIPTDSIVMKIDKEAVRRSGMKMLSDTIPDFMTISLFGKRTIYKSELMLLEMLAHANWTRPLYMAITVGESIYGSLGNNFLQEGLAFRIVPWDTRKMGITMDADVIYDHMMNDFKYGNVKRRGIYIDETTKGMCWTHRAAFARTAGQLIKEGKTEKARRLLIKCEQELPEYSLPANWRSGTLDIGRCWAQLGDLKRARHELGACEKQAQQYLRWYAAMSDAQLANNTREFGQNLSVLAETGRAFALFDKAKAERIEAEVNRYYNQLLSRTGGAGLGLQQ